MLRQILGFSGAAGALGGPLLPAPNGLIVGNDLAPPAMVAGRRPMSSATCASTRLGAARRSWAPLHEVNPLYYAWRNSCSTSGHPGDQWGWAVGAGIKFNAPFISPGDYFVSQVNYTRAPPIPVERQPNSNADDVKAAARATASGSDCVFGGTAAAGTPQLPADHGLELSTSPTSITGRRNGTSRWCINGMWRSTAGHFGQRHAVRLARATAWRRHRAVAARRLQQQLRCTGASVRACQWDVTKSFYIGVEAIYRKIDSAHRCRAANSRPPLPWSTPARRTASNQSNWEFTVRMHKDFLP